jgi:hypothetical protein
MAPALPAKLFELEAIRSLLLVLAGDVIPVLALGALQRNVVSWHNSPISVYDKLQLVACSVSHSNKLEFVRLFYSITSDTVPAPTVRPPSLIANLNPFSIAIGAINSIVNCELSPGITISTPSFNVATPVTSVVLK